MKTLIKLAPEIDQNEREMLWDDVCDIEHAAVLTKETEMEHDVWTLVPNEGVTNDQFIAAIDEMLDFQPIPTTVIKEIETVED